jgi:hypothetical protein
MELDDPGIPADARTTRHMACAGKRVTPVRGGMLAPVRIEGTVERDALEWAIRRALQEAEPVSAAFYGRRVCVRGWRRARRLTHKSAA